MRINVRPATNDDIPWLIAQLKNFSEFYGTYYKLFGSEEFAQSFLDNLIKNHVVFVAESEAVGLVGLIAGYSVPHLYNREMKVLSELFWWVDETYRGSRAGAMLLRAFEDYGRANCDWIIMTLIENRSPVHESSLIKRGYHLHERSYLLEVGV